MTQPFSNHLAQLQPGSADVEALQEAAKAVDTLMAYAEARGLELSTTDAEAIVQAAATRPLSESELDGVAGGYLFIPNKEFQYYPKPTSSPVIGLDTKSQISD